MDIELMTGLVSSVKQMFVFSTGIIVQEQHNTARRTIIFL